jgi:hypothetical protein
MVVLVTLLGVAVGLLALLVTGLLRSHAEILRALNDLGVDLDPNRNPRADATLLSRAESSAVADVAGTDADGATQHVAVADVDHTTLLVFLSTTCLTCRDFWTAFADTSLDVPGRARVVIVTRGAEAESPSSVRRLAPRTVHTVMSTETWHAYNVPGAPYFILVDGARNRVIGEGTATAWDRVQELMRQAMADANEEPGNVDDALRAAGIEPGDPSLYPETGT